MRCQSPVIMGASWVAVDDGPSMYTTPVPVLRLIQIEVTPTLLLVGTGAV